NVAVLWQIPYQKARSNDRRRDAGCEGYTFLACQTSVDFVLSNKRIIKYSPVIPQLLNELRTGAAQYWDDNVQGEPDAGTCDNPRTACRWKRGARFQSRSVRGTRATARR